MKNMLDEVYGLEYFVKLENVSVRIMLGAHAGE